MGSCVKCDFREPEPGSLYCAICKTGNERIYESSRGRVGERATWSHPDSPTMVVRVAPPPHPRAKDTRELERRELERVPGQGIAPLLLDVLTAVLEGAPDPPPEKLAGGAPRVEELSRNPATVVIDDPIRYVGERREVALDELGVGHLSDTTGINAAVVRYLLITHGRCHESMRRCYEAQRVAAGPQYDDLDVRIREHYSQLVMFYLLFGPGWVKGLLPVKYHHSLPPSDRPGFLRDFMALDEFQSGPLRVDPRDFSAARPTASIEKGVELPAHGFVTDFEKWHKFVILRPAVDCVERSRRNGSIPTMT